MPIISPIGARSLKVRLIYTGIFLVLILGALTMVYPFILMLSGSVKSDADAISITPYPAFWFDDTVLFQKYVESKYNDVLSFVTAAWWKDIRSWRQIQPPDDPDRRLLEDFLAWRREFNPPVEWYALAHSEGGRMLPKNGREFRRLMVKQFNGDINAYSQKAGLPTKSWTTVTPPSNARGFSRRYRPAITGIEEPFLRFKTSRPVSDRVLFNLDGIYWSTALVPRYTTDIQEYNRRHGTRYVSYRQIFLTPRAPWPGPARQDWEQFVRKELNLVFIHLDPDLAGPYRKWLSTLAYETIGQFNAKYGTRCKSFAEVPFPTTVPPLPIAQVDWERFIGDSEVCPAEGIKVHGPRQEFEKFVARRRNLPLEKVGALVLPITEADYHDAMSHRGELRWEFTTRNYKHVLEFIAWHGNGILNTVVYCALAIGASLLVNPLAAYALSRYRPPSAYKILLFCMATMAFPGEVTMIPGFLLLKRFPFWPLALGGVTFLVVLWLINRFGLRWSEGKRMIVALGLAILAGTQIPSLLFRQPSVSLLNTFAALVLPGMANGFFIFLLKGFFDSLPRELYEAAEIDGAGEWTKFWTITMNLSKPVLAVIALSAFTSAYSAFMMAIIIIPDQNMWTLMVWIYQLQSQSHPSVVYASLVIAAIPTFLVFVLCQNIIMRGIVIPTEK